jgi:hypothetical protein
MRGLLYSSRARSRRFDEWLQLRRVSNLRSARGKDREKNVSFLNATSIADVNVQGHLPYLHHLLETLDLWPILVDLNLQFATFADLQLSLDVDDRFLWRRCQAEDWTLWTDNRNEDGPDSLQATLNDSWQSGNLPVLTLANKRKFEHDLEYAKRVAIDVAELLFGIENGDYRDCPRIYIPL